ncbi:MAG: hypothetical protein ABSG04_16925 [Verrucomicrobiota bacterium]
MDADTKAHENAASVASGTFNPAAFSGTSDGSVVAPAPYGLSEVVVTTPSSVAGASFNYYIAVPDGGLTVAMIGCVFVGLAVIRSRLGKRA